MENNSITYLGIGGYEKTDNKNMSVTSIKFSVPISLPFMDNNNKPSKKRSSNKSDHWE